MARNLAAARRKEIFARNLTPDERAQRFANSVKGSREWHRLQGGKTCLDGADFFHGMVLTEREIRFYRFEGVLIKQGPTPGMMISDMPERWPLIDEIKKLLDRLAHLKSRGQKGKPVQRQIEQLAAQI